MAKFINGKVKPKKTIVKRQSEPQEISIEVGFDKPKFEVQKRTEEIQAYSPAVLLSIAVEKGRSLEEISRLMDLQDRWEAKVARTEFLLAKNKFQHEVPVIRKEKNVNFPTKQDGQVDYNYAPLGVIGETIKNAMFESGLSYNWIIDDSGQKIKVTCVVSHAAGHQETATMEAAIDTSGKKSDIQGRASTITYLQRYTLIGALGLTTADRDDDGRSNHVMPYAHRNEEIWTHPPALPVVTTEQFGPIMTNVITGKWTVEKVKEMRSLTENQEKALQVAEDSRKDRPV